MFCIEGGSQLRARYRKEIYFILDCIMVNLALYGSLLIKYDAAIPNCFIRILPVTFIITTIVSEVIYYISGLYFMLWIYASIEELMRIFFATIVSQLIQIIVATFFQLRLPITVYMICWMITFLGIGGIRFGVRIIRKINIMKQKEQAKKRVMIIGAGEAASLLIKEIKNNKRSIYKPVVSIDDDPVKHQTQINGVPVITGRDKIIAVAAEMNIHEIMIAIPSISRKKTADLIRICEKTGCRLKVLPSVYGLVNGEISVKHLRDVTVEDLLPREEINLEEDEILDYIKGKTVLVTGGGGSIGSELCRQIAEYRPDKLLIFDIYENNVYDLQNELLEQYQNTLDLSVIIGSIRDRTRLEYIFQMYHPEIVFHAAAHKHVPLMEHNPQEAVKNNIYGTLNVAECADKYHCNKFVLISTDKAVNPTSIMGATKRAAEIIIKNMDKKSQTKFCAVRFGNVLGSNGSVIPLFKKQIEHGGPISVTHPEVTRYFMTIPEAACLVLQSGAMTEGGEIFVLDMGEPVKILDLAKSLITLSGLKPDIDIQIEFTGLRPGEKLYEELLVTEEEVNVTKNNKIYIEKDKDTDYSDYIRLIEQYRPVESENWEETYDFIKELIPSYQNNRN